MKTVVVTGASRGIGRAIACEFAKQGDNVVICYNNSKSKAEELAKELGQYARVMAIKVDVSKECEVVAMVEETLKTYGNIDVLVNCAGIAQIKMLIDSTQEDFKRILDTNLLGVLNTCKHVSKVMLRNQKGRIINISSIWGSVGGSCESVYSASKGAINAFTKALSKELGPNGITVNAVAPGFIDTDMNCDVSDEIREEIRQNTSLQRLGRVDDVAKIVLFLSSEDASFITGQIVGVDGGMI